MHIEAGKVADLVITRQDPMTDPGSLRDPVAVVKNGQWLDQAVLQELRELAKNPSNAYLTLGHMLEFLIFA